MNKVTVQFARAWKVLKSHYVVLVFVCVISMIIGAEFFDTYQFAKQEFGDWRMERSYDGISVYTVLKLWSQGDTESSIETAETLMQHFVEAGKDNKVFGHSRGVMARAVNKVMSGYFLVQMMILLTNLFNSQNIATLFVIILLMILLASFWLFVRNIFVVITRRICLECQAYEKVTTTRVFFLYRTKRWLNISWVMFVSFGLQVLWSFTIVGGIIKRYSYYLVPYIIAENPTLNARQAIGLSKRMMKGRKWKLFLREAMFWPLTFLSFVTGGIFDVLLVNPLKISFMTGCYVDIRERCVKQGLDGIELLNDHALYLRADKDELASLYEDVYDFPDHDNPDKMLGFFSRWFGITFFENESERQYEELLEKKVADEDLLTQKNGEAYPDRLCPFAAGLKKSHRLGSYYMCHYSIWNLILMFFIFAGFGWLWEVALHLFNTGEFVNRGMMYGPWLPIYGTGGVLILVVLYRFRAKPALEFGLAVALSAIIEFGTSFYMELTHDGMRWWDYTGYFMNLGGRICAEGLFVFGLGGSIVVYFLAPRINRILRKFPVKKTIAVAVILVAIFLVDMRYSSDHPNSGKGITTQKKTSFITDGFVEHIGETYGWFYQQGNSGA